MSAAVSVAEGRKHFAKALPTAISQPCCSWSGTDLWVSLSFDPMFAIQVNVLPSARCRAGTTGGRGDFRALQ